jgi:hypothetical protein
MEDIKTFAESQHTSVQVTKSSAALKAIPEISENLVAHIEGLLAVSPQAT